MRIWNFKHYLKLFATVVCGGALIVGYSYYAISTGSAFKSFVAWCGESKSMAAEIGEFKNAELVFLGASAYEKDKGDTGAAGFKARIAGSRKVLLADVKMKRLGDTWTVDQVNLAETTK